MIVGTVFTLSFPPTSVSVEEVITVVVGISSTAIGSNNICIHMSHTCCPFILTALTLLVNTCLLDCVFLPVCKIANVISIYKSRNCYEATYKYEVYTVCNACWSIKTKHNNLDRQCSLNDVIKLFYSLAF